MTVIQIGMATSSLLIGIVALYFINKQAIIKHNFTFLTVVSFMMVAISLSLMLAGYNWFINAMPNSDDIMNGIGMGAIGAIVGLFLIVWLKRARLMR